MPSSACKTCADRKSTRLNSSHTIISYAVFCLKKKKNTTPHHTTPPPPPTPHRPERRPADRRSLIHVPSTLLPYTLSHFVLFFFFFFFNDTATTEIYTLSLHDALPISQLLAGKVIGLGLLGLGNLRP